MSTSVHGLPIHGRKWAVVKDCGMGEATIVNGEKKTVERRYGIS
ncbi:MAG: hypothetical protein ACTTI3_06105 [Treponema sp.]